MKIREMQEIDIDRIATITIDSWSEISARKRLEDRHGVIGKKSWRDKKGEEVRSFCLSNPSNVIVILENDIVVGYATFSIDEENAIGFILNNAVDPAFQGGGIGTAMNAWIIDHFRMKKLRVARVSTAVSNVGAQKIYEKQGFKELGRMLLV